MYESVGRVTETEVYVSGRQQYIGTYTYIILYARSGLVHGYGFETTEEGAFRKRCLVVHLMNSGVVKAAVEA